MYRYTRSLTLLITFLTVWVAGYSQGDQFVTSGDEELDRIRREVEEHPTSRENFELRALKMKLWVVTLQQQGARLEAYLPVDSALNRDTWWNTIDRNNGNPQQFTPQQMARLTRAVDRGYRILDSIQNNLANNRVTAKEPESVGDMEDRVPVEIPWTHYKGNKGLTGYTGAGGPVTGEGAWKFPVGLAWESVPVIENSRIYLSSPGMRTLMMCLDLETGEEIWHTNQVPEIMGDQLYNTPGNHSTPVILDKSIMYRELGARGNKGPAKEIGFIDKATGTLGRDMVAGRPVLYTRSMQKPGKKYGNLKWDRYALNPASRATR